MVCGPISFISSYNSNPRHRNLHFSSEEIIFDTAKLVEALRVLKKIFLGGRDDTGLEFQQSQADQYVLEASLAAQ